MPTELQEYLFDLRGYLMLEEAVDADHLVELNALVDDYTDMDPGEWRGWVRRSPKVTNAKHIHSPGVRDGRAV